MAGMYEGWPGYLTWDEEVKLAQYGWELGSHTYIHKPLPLPPARNGKQISRRAMTTCWGYIRRMV